jgi:hypothetical protein
MPHESNSNAPSSAKTSTTPPVTSLSESQYLAQQQADAKKAIERSLEQLRAELMQSADPRAWMQTHPWMTLCASAVAGFVASAATVPSKEQQALNRLAKLEEVVARAEHPERFNGNGQRKSGGAITGIIYRIVQPMIVSTLTGFLSGKAAAEEPTGGMEPGAAATVPDEALRGADPGI